MPRKASAGLLMYRRKPSGLEVFLVHPGGPYFARKDEGVWSIPKGEFEPGEDPLDAARREFTEETGLTPGNELMPLGSVQQRGGKTVLAWAFESPITGAVTIRSNPFQMEWPPGSGRVQSFPEADRGEFFTAEEGKRKINPAQAAFIDRLEEHLRQSHTRRT